MFAICLDNPSEIQFIVNLEPAQIIKLAEELIARSQRIHDLVASVPIQKVNFSTSEDLCALSCLSSSLLYARSS